MNNYYCVLPYYSVETEFQAPSKNIFCCRLRPGTNIEDVRRSIENKERSPACSTCWALEDRGLKSERQIHNETMDYLLDLNLDNIENASITKGFQPVKIKIATSNLCNGQCVTCNSSLSSSWAALEGKSSRYRSFNINELGINWKEIVSLSFVGGEPLLEKQNFTVLETLIAEGNTNCFISFVTNGSVELSEHQIEILSQFPKLNMCVSIDGVGNSFEYMRFPLQWNRLLTNIGLFKDICEVSVSCMISNLNIYYYSQFVDFFKDNNINYLCKQVEDPAIFSPGNLPDQAKDMVRNNNTKYMSEVDSFLSTGTYSVEKFDRLKREIARQDALKGISIRDYMPDVANFL
jgi:sulfatase maturation enzyme AslB (radical SAM superfamily)